MPQDFQAAGIPLVQAINPEKELVKLVHADTLDEFVPMLNLIDTDTAISFAQCVHKCRQYELKEREEFYFLVARAMVAVPGKNGKGNRADLFAQAASGVFLPGSLGEAGRGGVRRNRDERPNS